VVSYLFVLLLLVGPLVAWILTGVLRNQFPPAWILVPNPLSALFSAFAPSVSYGGSSPALFELSRVLGGMAVGGGTPSGFVLPRPIYHYTLPFYGLLSLALYLLATRLVRPTQRWRIRAREITLALSALLVLILAVGIPFLLTLDRYERNDSPSTLEGKPLRPWVETMGPEVPVQPLTVIEPGVDLAPTPTSTPEADQEAQ
jgi:hypothetical protein